MAAKLNGIQRDLLREYGRLYRLHHSKVYHIDVKSQLEQAKQEMKRENLTHEDYVEFTKMEKYLATADGLIQEEEQKKATESSGVIKIVIGVLLLFLGIGLSADTPFLFYGLIFSAIGLIVKGGMDLYYK